MTTVTVLGGSGFLGSAFTAAVSARPVRLRVLSRRPAPVPADARADVEVRRADVADPGVVAAAVAGADVVVNLLKHDGDWRRAGTDPRSELVNTGTTAAIVAALRGRRSSGRHSPAVCVFAGTVSQVGVPPERPLDGSEPDRPQTPYDAQKLEAERLLLAATAAGVLRGVSLRLPTIYGQGPAAAAPDVGVIAAMIRRALDGAPLTMWGDGRVMREFVHVEDTVRAFLAAIDGADRLSGRHWLLGTGAPSSLRDALHLVSGAVAAVSGAAPVPVVAVPPPAHATATDLRSVRVDPVPFSAAAGWFPRVTLAEGISRTAAALFADRDRAARNGVLA
ncbi:NAD-dependent epimerase/dehydratase family protein [Dactylosporangium sp. NPDC049140]|uniref:NAD-dependent epimerase/dehydratase family protein n=1 Tax=Dactylosporangium sp. NPDC049140 TaxID=3155647 RepID=UPI0033E0BAEC